MKLRSRKWSENNHISVFEFVHLKTMVMAAILCFSKFYFNYLYGNAARCTSNCMKCMGKLGTFMENMERGFRRYCFYLSFLVVFLIYLNYVFR